MKTLKLLVLGAALMSGLTACPRENIIFSTDPRIVRGNWAGSAKRVCANVSQTAWSPDGTKIASNGNRTTIWDATTGARVRVIGERSGQVVWNGTSIITVSTPTYSADNPGISVKFWNPSSGMLERSLNVTGNSLVIRPDGTRGVVNAFENGQGSARVISLMDGSIQRSLTSGNDSSFFVWTSDGKRIVAQVNAAVITPTHSPPEPLPAQWRIRVWSVATGAIERDFLGEIADNALGPDGKTLLYSAATGLQLLNLETGTVRTLPISPQYSVLGWNPSSSKIYLSTNNTTEIWDVGTLKLEKTLPATVYGWNSVGAPADTGVTSYAQYDDCSLKILDLKTLNVTRKLDETSLDALEVKLSLNATYFNESEYGITGTANTSGTSFKVRGKGYAGTNQRFLPQASPVPMGASFELLNDAGAVVWSVPNSFGFPMIAQDNTRTFTGFLTNSSEFRGSYDPDGYNLKPIPAP